MKSWLWKGMIAVAIALPALSGVAQAQSDEGCSDATLKGEYAFGVTAYTPPGLPNGPPRVVAGIKFFDDKGTFTQRDYRGDSLRTSGLTEFSTGETGTHTVNSDCTGSVVVNQNVFGVPPVTTQGGTHKHQICDQQRWPSYPRSRRRVHSPGSDTTCAHPD